jgi:hypothetical protein
VAVRSIGVQRHRIAAAAAVLALVALLGADFGAIVWLVWTASEAEQAAISLIGPAAILLSALLGRFQKHVPWILFLLFLAAGLVFGTPWRTLAGAACLLVGLSVPYLADRSGSRVLNRATTIFLLLMAVTLLAGLVGLIVWGSLQDVRPLIALLVICGLTAFAYPVARLITGAVGRSRPRLDRDILEQRLTIPLMVLIGVPTTFAVISYLESREDRRLRDQAYRRVATFPVGRTVFYCLVGPAHRKQVAVMSSRTDRRERGFPLRAEAVLAVPAAVRSDWRNGPSVDRSALGEGVDCGLRAHRFTVCIRGSSAGRWVAVRRGNGPFTRFHPYREPGGEDATRASSRCP